MQCETDMTQYFM